ncbi:MAG TPA: rhodanese-like domain-containing protein [Bacteroidia bacterium]|jgi:rhodanese-related sulfurtransferase|nr:rhodanese-like domain-containing protein [Bacteroidia bacterium]
MRPVKLILLFTFVASISVVIAQTEVNSLLPMEFKVLSEKTKGIIIDVRNKSEYEFAHILNAIQIGVESEDFLTQIRSLDKNKAYFLYCSIGKRSDEAIRIMQSEGFKNVYGLKGGFLAWKKEKLPVIKHSKK